ncbi:MAG: DUF3352 domain-containing protein [Actinomycetota bacterium]|nr:DUF3352 domain-containing protein [Actinomycetota bacterium]
MTRSPRFLAAGLLATLAVAVAGCGGGGAKTSASGESGAKLVRSGALAFVALNSDLGSSQWQQVDDLSKKFPGRSKVLEQIKQAFAKQGVDYDKDIKPALGPEVDVAVVSGASAGQTSFALLTKPDDAAKFKQLVAKLNASDTGPSAKPAVYTEVDGWYAVSESQAQIDAVLKDSGGQALSEDATFTAALGKLPGEALVKAFLDGQQLNELIRGQSQKSGSPFDPSSVGLDKLEFVAASTSAENDGIRVRGAANGANVGGSEFSSKLLGGVPGDALAFLGFRGAGTTDQLKKLESNPTVGQALQQIQAGLGVSFDDILALLRGEVALYVRPGAGIPEVTLALETKDQSAALSILDKLAARLAAAAGATVQPGKQGAHDVKTLNLGQIAVHYGGLGDKVLITSGVNGIADYGASGQRLPDSAAFKQAQSAAGMPDSTGGFLYLDLKDSIPLLEGLAGLAGQTPPAEVTENVRPLRSFLAWTEGSGGARTFDAFLEIK